MSAEDQKIIDIQPQQSISVDYGANDSRPSEQTTENQNQNEATLVGYKALEHLQTLEVVQRLDILEVCLGWTRNNRYCIFSEEGEQIFYVYEASVCFNRQVTGALRGLDLKMSMSDEDQEDVVLLRRPAACSSRCCWACFHLQKMEVLLPSGFVLAKVCEIWSCCVPNYQVTDGMGHLLWSVKGDLCHCRCCCQLQFQFRGSDGTEVASITRSCQGCKELIGAANRFTVHFGDDLTAEQKLIVLGTSFLIDLNYFEKQNKCW